MFRLVQNHLKVLLCKFCSHQKMTSTRHAIFQFCLCLCGVVIELITNTVKVCFRMCSLLAVMHHYRLMHLVCDCTLCFDSDAIELIYLLITAVVSWTPVGTPCRKDCRLFLHSSFINYSSPTLSGLTVSFNQRQSSSCSLILIVVIGVSIIPATHFARIQQKALFFKRVLLL